MQRTNSKLASLGCWGLYGYADEFLTIAPNGAIFRTLLDGTARASVKLNGDNQNAGQT